MNENTSTQILLIWRTYYDLCSHYAEIIDYFLAALRLSSLVWCFCKELILLVNELSWAMPISLDGHGLLSHMVISLGCEIMWYVKSMLTHVKRHGGLGRTDVVCGSCSTSTEGARLGKNMKYVVSGRPAQRWQQGTEDTFNMKEGD